MSASSTLPPLLAANPRLDRWVGFPAPGRVTVWHPYLRIPGGIVQARTRHQVFHQRKEGPQADVAMVLPTVGSRRRAE